MRLVQANPWRRFSVDCYELTLQSSLLQAIPWRRFSVDCYELTLQSSTVTPHMSTQNIFLIGLMAVGKSSVGRRLANVLDCPFFDSDEEIERRAGAAISWIFDVEGEAGFRDREQQVIDDLSQREGIVLATGGGAVLRNANRQRLAQRGFVVHLHSPLDRLVARTQNDRNRPLLQADDPRKVLEELYAQREPLYAEIADLKIITAQQSVNGLVSQLAKKIRLHRSSG